VPDNGKKEEKAVERRRKERGIRFVAEPPMVALFFSFSRPRPRTTTCSLSLSALPSLTTNQPTTLSPSHRLFGYGLGIHLIQGEPVQRPSKINPRGDHLSFQVRAKREEKRRGAAVFFF